MTIKWTAIEQKTTYKAGGVLKSDVDTVLFLTVDVDGRIYLKDYSPIEKRALDYDVECLVRGENPFKDWDREPLSMVCEMLLKYTDKKEFHARFFDGIVILPNEPHNIKSREVTILALRGRD